MTNDNDSSRPGRRFFRPPKSAPILLSERAKAEAEVCANVVFGLFEGANAADACDAEVIRAEDRFAEEDHGQPILDRALAIAASGLPVFPCRPSNKKPLTKNGFYDATTNRRQIGVRSKAGGGTIRAR
jgi:hypothetical protein